MATNEISKNLYANLGRSGLRISKVVLGAMSYGTPDWQGWVLDEAQSLPLLEYAYKAGIRTWDTANIYSHGRSEEIIGKAIKQFSIPREKLPEPSTVNDGEMLNMTGLSRKHILDAVDKSVARLGTYIDVLQIHRLDRSVPREEIMRALNDVVESGKVRYIGASSMAAWEFQELQYIADKHNWHKFVSMQDYYNLLYREEENEMIPYCKHAGIGLIPWSPVARGALTRPWNDRANSLRETKDAALNKLVRGRNDKVDEEIVGRCQKVAEKIGKSMAQVAIAWCLNHGTCPIVGLNKKERIDEAVAACDIVLRDEDIAYLEEPYMPKKRQGY
ncbi:Versiconal hemiacetal acetate [Cyphellophora attinorum]|uniref:Versiconal hemiacetal acetate n=1 Tax=Cyphellophora attinorum TaxID=1664694 RepID=A0A0N1HU03_9EURO|nr:Versiconal hemiacetal acetate [Phialophora attinorum]KPI40203.1 Versiconal hemiacetal acetate [Phialophora attinorum]